MVERKLRRSQILDRRADRLEHRDLIVIPPSGARAARQIEEIAGNIVLTQHAGFKRLDDIARLFERALARVNEDAGSPDAIVVGLTHVRTEAANEVQMDAERQPISLNKRSLAQ